MNKPFLRFIVLLLIPSLMAGPHGWRFGGAGHAVQFAIRDPKPPDVRWSAAPCGGSEILQEQAFAARAVHHVLPLIGPFLPLRKQLAILALGLLAAYTGHPWLGAGSAGLAVALPGDKPTKPLGHDPIEGQQRTIWRGFQPWRSDEPGMRLEETWGVDPMSMPSWAVPEGYTRRVMAASRKVWIPEMVSVVTGTPAAFRAALLVCSIVAGFHAPTGQRLFAHIVPVVMDYPVLLTKEEILDFLLAPLQSDWTVATLAVESIKTGRDPVTMGDLLAAMRRKKVPDTQIRIKELVPSGTGVEYKGQGLLGFGPWGGDLLTINLSEDSPGRPVAKSLRQDVQEPAAPAGGVERLKPAWSERPWPMSGAAKLFKLEGGRLASVGLSERTIEIIDWRNPAEHETIHVPRRVGELLLDVAMTPDGQHFAVVTPRSLSFESRGFKAGKGKAIVTRAGGSPSSIALSRDAKMVIAVSNSKLPDWPKLLVWDLAAPTASFASRRYTGSDIPFLNRDQPKTKVVLAADGRRALTVGPSGKVSAWELPPLTGKAVRKSESLKVSNSFFPPELNMGSPAVLDLALDDSGDRLVTLSDDGKIRVYNVRVTFDSTDPHRSLKKVITSQSATDQKPLVVDISSDGRWAATGHQDGRVWVWSLESGEPVAILDQGVTPAGGRARAPVASVVISEEGFVAASSRDGLFGWVVPGLVHDLPAAPAENEPNVPPILGPKGRMASIMSEFSDEIAPAMRNLMPGYFEWKLANRIHGFVQPADPEGKNAGGSQGDPAAPAGRTQVSRITIAIIATVLLALPGSFSLGGQTMPKRNREPIETYEPDRRPFFGRPSVTVPPRQPTDSGARRVLLRHLHAYSRERNRDPMLKPSPRERILIIVTTQEGYRAAREILNDSEVADGLKYTLRETLRVAKRLDSPESSVLLRNALRLILGALAGLGAALLARALWLGRRRETPPPPKPAVARSAKPSEPAARASAKALPLGPAAKASAGAPPVTLPPTPVEVPGVFLQYLIGRYAALPIVPQEFSSDFLVQILASWAATDPRLASDVRRCLKDGRLLLGLELRKNGERFSSTTLGFDDHMQIYRTSDPLPPTGSAAPAELKDPGPQIGRGAGVGQTGDTATGPGSEPARRMGEPKKRQGLERRGTVGSWWRAPLRLVWWAFSPAVSATRLLADRSWPPARQGHGRAPRGTAA